MQVSENLIVLDVPIRMLKLVAGDEIETQDASVLTEIKVKAATIKIALLIPTPHSALCD